MIKISYSFAVDGAFVVFDRDGTLIHHVHHLSEIDQVLIFPDVASSLKRIATAGFEIGLISNQSVIGRKLASEDTVRSINQKIEDELALEGIHFEFVLICPHIPEDNCECRKPRPGMSQIAQSEFGLIPELSFMVGDQPTDVEFARNSGMTPIGIRNQDILKGEVEYYFDNLEDFADWLLKD